jgi:hypothetical protein
MADTISFAVCEGGRFAADKLDDLYARLGLGPDAFLELLSAAAAEDGAAPPPAAAAPNARLEEIVMQVAPLPAEKEAAPAPAPARDRARAPRHRVTEAEVRVLPAAAPAAPAGTYCRACGGRCEQLTHQSRCTACGLLEDSEGDAVKLEITQPNIKIVGCNASKYQLNLYGTGGAATRGMQARGMFEEYYNLARRYHAAGGAMVPQNVLWAAAQAYADVQQAYVKRGDLKREIMADLLCHAATEKEMYMSRETAAALVQLPSASTARGAGFVRDLVAVGAAANVPAAGDALRGGVNMIFARVYRLADTADLAAHAGAIAAVLRVVRLMQEHEIADRSVEESRVAGAAYAVLQRRPGAPDLAAFCELVGRGKNTVERVLADIRLYPDLFREAFASVA